MVYELTSHIGNGSKSLYDPIKRAEDTARIVCSGNRRRYYRFRPPRDITVQRISQKALTHKVMCAVPVVILDTQG
ncbi:MAG TPA: hypothetical protein VMW89_19070 [Desulfatiglandales bacterium]|nr:hypothetical protein [Desulfatiglandales bacterium]